MRDDEHGEQGDSGIGDGAVDIGAAVVGTAGVLGVLGEGGGIVPAVAAAAAPPALALAWKLGRRVVDRRQERQQQLVEITAGRVGGLDVLDKMLDGPPTVMHDARLELLGRVLEAAGHSTLPEKIPGLARVLVDGLGDEEGAVDDALALAAALDDIEARHVLVLQLLATTPVPPLELRREQSEDLPPTGWETEELDRALPAASGTIEQVIAVLNRHGLVFPGGGGTYPGHVGPVIYRLAPLGACCLWLLTDPDGLPPQPPA